MLNEDFIYKNTNLARSVVPWCLADQNVSLSDNSTRPFNFVLNLAPKTYASDGCTRKEDPQVEPKTVSLLKVLTLRFTVIFTIDFFIHFLGTNRLIHMYLQEKPILWNIFHKCIFHFTWMQNMIIASPTYDIPANRSIRPPNAASQWRSYPKNGHSSSPSPPYYLFQTKKVRTNHSFVTLS